MGGRELSNHKSNGSISPREKALLKLIKEIGHGEMKVIIQDGEPIRIEEIAKSIKL